MFPSVFDNRLLLSSKQVLPGSFLFLSLILKALKNRPIAQFRRNQLYDFFRHSTWKIIHDCLLQADNKLPNSPMAVCLQEHLNQGLRFTLLCRHILSETNHED